MPSRSAWRECFTASQAVWWQLPLSQGHRMQSSGGFLRSVGAWHMRTGCTGWNVATGEAPNTATDRKQMMSRKQYTALGPSSSGPSRGDSSWSKGKLLEAQSSLNLATPWTVACQTPLSLGFSSQEYWSGVRFLSPGDLPDLGIKLGSPTLQADALLTEPLFKVN